MFIQINIFTYDIRISDDIIYYNSFCYLIKFIINDIIRHYMYVESLV